MLKIVVKNFKLFRTLLKYNFIRKFLIFDIRSLESLNIVSDYAFAISVFSTESSHGKTTYKDRFLDMDSVTLKYLKQQDKIVIHDVGVSSGITSCDLLKKVKEIDKNFHFLISDKYLNFYFSGNNVVRIYNSEKKLLFGYIFGIFADKKVSKYFPLTKYLFYLLKAIPYPKIFSALQLFDYETKQFLNKCELNYVEYDLFGQNFLENISFVRCMNVLNANSWFSNQQIIDGVFNLKSSLIEGGILLIGRTDDCTGKNNASYFKKINGKLVHLEDFNLGSDVKNIIKNI